MSAGDPATKAGPSGSASKDVKAKRSRKRQRNKKRTTEVEDSSSSSSSSDDSDDEDDKQVKAAPIVAASTPIKKTKADADSDSDGSDSEKSDGGEEDAKRKRKRKRKVKTETKDKTAKPATPSASVKSAPSTAKSVALSPDQVGPDPNTDLRLSDQAKQAISYAQVYTTAKSEWKFNKAKQNWLLRNALSVPPSDYDASLARKQADGNGTENSTAEEADEEAEEGDNFVPNDFVPVVTAYLSSVMGGARQRMIESLKEAVNAPAITVAPTQPEGTDDAAATTSSTNVAADGVAANGAVTKSVSFGNLALEAEKTEEATAEAGLPEGTDPRSVEPRRTRATQMLKQMGESL
ncbi:Protein of unknown function DUF2373 [Kalmanozyma brasiliensis GHG001]|uniref:WKF domain-containing protein n=1 Tax=Kalmanozyma brasiliensis (strain GHG001) TaxID=1365824 RepID=V5EYA7_KALBG|nr:Protein of unknown function DUF2373 [Kalmanozyma brasiliensis GHG001]EST07669.1 Protein of unknown function DUF2373 [Kalmanozyma brasiliensis GHG001]